MQTQTGSSGWAIPISWWNRAKKNSLKWRVKHEKWEEEEEEQQKEGRREGGGAASLLPSHFSKRRDAGTFSTTSLLRLDGFNDSFTRRLTFDFHGHPSPLQLHHIYLYVLIKWSCFRILGSFVFKKSPEKKSEMRTTSSVDVLKDLCWKQSFKNPVRGQQRDWGILNRIPEGFLTILFKESWKEAQDDDDVVCGCI